MRAPEAAGRATGRENVKTDKAPDAPNDAAIDGGRGERPPRARNPVFGPVADLFRLLGTASAFVLFGLGGLIFPFVAAPGYLFGPKDPRSRTLRARRIVRAWFAIFVAVIRGLGLVRVEVKNAGRLERPGLILLANHPSLIDVVCLMSKLGNATTIVKASLAKNLFTRAPIRAAGYVPNDAGPDALQPLLAELDAGTTFVIFPEGTRTPVDLPPGEYPRMHRGAVVLALEARRPITPVRITARPRWLTKDRAWWKLPPEPMTLTFEVLEDLPVDDYQELYNSRPPKAARRLTAELARRLFEVDPSRAKDGRRSEALRNEP